MEFPEPHVTSADIYERIADDIPGWKERGFELFLSIAEKTGQDIDACFDEILRDEVNTFIASAEMFPPEERTPESIAGVTRAYFEDLIDREHPLAVESVEERGETVDLLEEVQ